MATSELTFNDKLVNGAFLSAIIEGDSAAMGGDGGSGYTGSNGVAGGAADATSDITGTASVLGTANSSGGIGGQGGQDFELRLGRERRGRRFLDSGGNRD